MQDKVLSNVLESTFVGIRLIRGNYDYDNMNNKMNVHTDSAAALIRLETLCHE